MAYGIVNHFPGGTQEQYDTVRNKVAPDGMPKGELHHVAGATDDGWMVSVVWESKAVWEAFRDGTLMPAMGELGDKAFPGPPNATEFEVYKQLHT